MIPYGRQDITEEDIEEVIKVLRSDFITQGDVVPAFEKKLAEYSKSKFSIVVNSATSALHIACKALSVGPGDLVWTSANTFAASSNCALYCGANVDFVDIDPETYNISIEALTNKLEIAKKNKRLPQVIIPVHLCGQSCDMRSIHELSKKFGFKIIEDASHAIGGKYLDKPIGSCDYSDITVFSFHPVKIITTGEGGAALTNDAMLANKMKVLSSHGITRDIENMNASSVPGPWYYEQISLGHNYRMTEISAALGLNQLRRIDRFVSRRHSIATYYNQKLSSLPLRIPYQHEDNYSSFHLYVIRLDLEDINLSYSEVYNELRDKGIGVNLHYMPVYMHPFYRNLGFKEGYCPEAEKYAKECISIPMFPGLNETEQDYVIDSFKNILS